MVRKLVSTVILPLVLLCACGTEKQKTEVKKETDRNKPIVVAITRNMPGYFIVGGEGYGYPYELLKAYAADRGREMQLQTGLSSGTLTENLKNGQTDVIVSLSADTPAAEILSLPLYSTTYVVLAPSKSAAAYRKSSNPVSEMLRGSMVMISSGFEGTKSYDVLLDSLSSAQLYVSAREGFDLARSLAANDFDLLICEKSEALLAEALLHNVSTVFEFEEPVPVDLTFDGEDDWLREDFRMWLEDYRNSKNFASLDRIYHQKGFGSKLPTINKLNRVVGGISVWDDMVREVGEKEEVDWRLLSAIAYNESRFRPDVESHMGAKGMMQIMPVTARFFKMEDSDLYDPYTSLTIAARLIKTIDNMVGFAVGTPAEDRLGIILAAYNGGIGFVMDARRLALSHGEDHDSWEAVSKYLVLMGDKDFAPRESVAYRSFTGSGETLAFVDKVREKYDTYRSSIQ